MVAIWFAPSIHITRETRETRDAPYCPRSLPGSSRVSRTPTAISLISTSPHLSSPDRAPTSSPQLPARFSIVHCAERGHRRQGNTDKPQAKNTIGHSPISSCLSCSWWLEDLDSCLRRNDRVGNQGRRGLPGDSPCFAPILLCQNRLARLMPAAGVW